MKENINQIPTKRGFGGKLTGFTDKAEKDYEQKHLKAYLKGFKFFRHGFKTNSLEQREPAYFPVIENWS